MCSDKLRLAGGRRMRCRDRHRASARVRWPRLRGPRCKFFPDDPILRDDDTAVDASGIKERELSESYDFLLQHVRVARRPRADPRRQREHARRGAGFELVHQPHRRPRSADRGDRAGTEQVRAPRRAGLGRRSRQEPWRFPGRLPGGARRAIPARCTSSKSIRSTTRSWRPAPKSLAR